MLVGFVIYFNCYIDNLKLFIKYSLLFIFKLLFRLMYVYMNVCVCVCVCVCVF